jgi:hypothetical protein
MCRYYSKISIPQFGLSSFIAHICHFSCHKIRKTFVLQTPTSREYHRTDILADGVNTPNTVTFSPLVSDEVLQIHPTWWFAHFCQPQTYNVVSYLSPVMVVVFQILFSNVSVPPFYSSTHLGQAVLPKVFSFLAVFCHLAEHTKVQHSFVMQHHSNMLLQSMLSPSLFLCVTEIWICIHFIWTCCTCCECTVPSQCAPHSWLPTPYLLWYVAFIYVHICADTICPGLAIQSCKVFKEYQYCALGFLPGTTAWVTDYSQCQHFHHIHTTEISFHLVFFADSLNIQTDTDLTFVASFSLPLCPTSSSHKSQVISSRPTLPLTQSHRHAFTSVIKRNKMVKINECIKFHVSK